MSKENIMGFAMKDEYTPVVEEKKEGNEEGATEEKSTEVADEKTTEVVEDKKEEEKKEEVSTDKVEENKDKSGIEDKKEETTEEKKETPVVEEKSSLNKIAELTNNQFKDENELFKAYSSLKKVDGKSIMESINKQVQEKYGDDTLTFSDLVATKNIDYNTMGDLDVLESFLYFEDPEITEKEVTAELQEFKLLSKSKEEIENLIENEKLTQEQYEALEAKLISRSRRAKKALQEYQSSINLDDFELHVPAEQAANNTNKKTEEEIQAELASYNATIDSFADVKINVGTKETPFDINIKVTDEDRNGIKDFCELKEGKNFVDRRWLGDDGRVKMDILSKDIYRILNYDRDIAVGFTQGKSEGVKEAIKDNDNINLKDKSGAHTDVVSDSDIHAKIAREINN